MKTASNKLRAGKHQSLISFTSPKQCTHCFLDKKAFSKNISDPFNMNPKFMKFSMFIYKIRWCVSIQKVSPHFCQDPDKTTTAAWLQPLHFLNTTILKYRACYYCGEKNQVAFYAKWDKLKQHKQSIAYYRTCLGLAVACNSRELKLNNDVYSFIFY